MKALSLTQPWADVILEQGKRIENRTKWTACKYRGPIFLHASSGLGSRAAIRQTLETVIAAGVSTTWLGSRFETCATHAGVVYHRARPALRLGGIVGRAELVDVIDPRVHELTLFGRGKNAGATSDPIERAEMQVGIKNQRRWWFGGFALVLANVEPLPFVPWTGALGLFDVDETAMREKAAALERFKDPAFREAFNAAGPR